MPAAPATLDTTGLAARSAAFTADVLSALTDARSGAGWCLGADLDEVFVGMAQIEARTRRSVLALSTTVRLEGYRHAVPLNARTARRPVSTRTVISSRARQLNPLAVLTAPHVLVGPVYLDAIVVDDELAVMYGPLDHASGRPSTWAVTRPDLMARLRAITAGILAQAVTLDQPWPPTTAQRRLQVALLLTEGLTDAAIARRLGVVRRTVATDVRAILDLLGATSRCQAGTYLR